MIFIYQVERTNLAGCWKLKQKVFYDFRGTSVKPFHIFSFKDLGIEHGFDEDLIVVSRKNVLRGLHFQNPPYAQAKIIYCISGSIRDVVLDIRKGSPTYGKYDVFILDGSKSDMLYISEGFAHGYLALEDNSIVMYKMSNIYKPEFESGVKWDSIGVHWGIENPIVSERDNNFLSFSQFKSEFLHK